MFTLEQINTIDKSYFRIIGSNQFSITLQSKNTGHEWHLLASDFRFASSCIVEHRHHHTDSFHYHGRYPSLLITIENIQSHDTWFINKTIQHQKQILKKHPNVIFHLQLKNTK